MCHILRCLCSVLKQLWTSFYRLSSREEFCVYWESEAEWSTAASDLRVVLPPPALGSAAERSGSDEALLRRSFQASLPKSFFPSFLSIAPFVSLLCSWFLITTFVFVDFSTACLYFVHVCFCTLWFERACMCRKNEKATGSVYRCNQAWHKFPASSWSRGLDRCDVTGGWHLQQIDTKHIVLCLWPVRRKHSD